MLFLTAFIPITMFARTLNPEFRNCMRQTVETYHTALIDSQRQYDDALIQAMETRRQSLVDSWSREDDVDQKNVQRDAGRTYSREVSDARTAKRDRDRVASRRYSDELRVCNRMPRISSSSSSSSSSFSFSSSRFSQSSSSRFSQSYSSRDCTIFMNNCIAQ